MYILVKMIASIVCDTWFKDVSVLHSEKVPMSGPVIFVGNHANQFVDAAMLIRYIPRQIRFLIAEKSLNKLILGTLARLAGCLPVKRAQDRAFDGLGSIQVLPKEEKIMGMDTRFKLDVKAGHSIVTSTGTYLVKAVISETELSIVPQSTSGVGGKGEGSLADKQKGEKLNNKDENKTLLKQNSSSSTVSSTVGSDDSETIALEYDQSWITFKVAPKIDQSEVYEEVSKTLKEDGSIGVFPEGGSHDRSDLLPLKPGVAIMALAAACDGVEDLMVVPVGIHYDEAHRVQSKAVLEYGNPVDIPHSLIEAYRNGDSGQKREAVSSFLKRVELALRACLVIAKDYETLRLVKLCVSLYPPERQRLNSEKRLLLRHLINEFFHYMEKEPTGKESREAHEASRVFLRTQLTDYAAKLEHHGFLDHEIWMLKQPAGSAFVLIGVKCLELARAIIVGVPPALLWGPMRVLTSMRAEAGRKKALTASSVKIQAQDVLASYRILYTLALVPTLNLIYGLLFGLFYIQATHWYGVFLWMVISAFGLPYVYYHSLIQYEQIKPLSRKLRTLCVVFLNKINKLRDTERDIITARMMMQLELRSLIFRYAHLVKPTAATGDTTLTQLLEDLVPRFVIDADSRRISTRIEDFTPMQRPFSHMETREEIL